MLEEKLKKIISRILVMILTLILVLHYNLAKSYASNINLPENQYLISKTERKIAPGINETEFISNDSSGNRQNMDYACEVDLSNTSTTKIISGYSNYNASSWGMDTVRSQAKAAEKATGYNVVAAINGDFYNMSNGQPMGAFVMNGKVYNKGNGQPYFAILKDGTATIRTANVSLDDVQEAIGGSAIIVKDGKAGDFTSNDAYIKNINPRTAIGIKADGTVVAYVNDGRNAPVSYGRTIQEVADMMEGLGCEIALNLDGGGSSTFCTKPEGSDKLSCRNNPSDGVERAVSNSLLIVSTAKPTGEFDHASISPNNLVYTPNSKVEFSAAGVDSSGGQAHLPEGLTWELEDSKYGDIDSNGKFTSNGTTGEVKVNLKNGDEVVGSTTITIAIPDSITFNNEEVSLGFSKESDLGIIVKYKGRDIVYKDGDFEWSLSDEKMGSFKGNTFVSSDSETINGDATVKCVYDKNISATVHLIIGKLPSVIWDFEDKINEETGATIAAEDYYSITSDPTDTTSLLYLLGYNRGGKRDGKVIDLDSGEPVRFGSHALRLDYDFTEATGTEGACIGYNRAGDPVDGNPTAVGMWVYAPEGTANLWLRMYVNDADGNNQQLDFTEEAKISEGKMGGIDWTGWRYVEASLEGKKGPFKLRKGETIRVMYVPGTQMGYYTKGATKEDGSYEMEYIPQAQRKGSIYIDNLQFVYGANNDDIDNPQVDSITANDVEIKDNMTIDTNTINFKSLYSDIENKNTSGIDYDTVRIYIDGVNMSSESNCVNVPGDETINLYEAKLSNGPHSVKVSVRDKFGNETVEIRNFLVNGSKEYSTIKLAPITEGNPILNKTFDLGLTADKIEEIDAVETEIKINKDFSNYEVKFSDDFEGKATYDSKNNVIKLEANRKTGASSQTGKVNIATIGFKISKDLKKGSVFTYYVQKGAITYNSKQEEGYTKSFATSQEKLKVMAPLTIKADQMVVGFDGKIYVNDVDGNPVSEALIYRDGTEIGKTNEDGYLQTDVLCQEVGKWSVYAAKGEDLSYSINVQTTSVAGNEDGLPEHVISNATTGSETSKNITWMSNPKTSENKAIMQIATKSDYDKNGEAAFKNIEGSSKLQSFLGSSDATLNKSVRVNKVLATGLVRNTNYAYRVGDGKVWSEVKEFKTNRAGTNTNFFVIGDTQVSNKDNVDKIAANLQKDGNYSFGIQTGDSVDNASIYSHWTDVLQLFGGNYISGVDMIHVLGNHEYMGDLEGDVANNIYNLPNNRRYSVEYGNVYTATISYTTSKAQLKEDLEWLKEDAKNSNAKWKVLTMHQPAYYTNTAGSNEMINELVPGAAEVAGIDFVFSGHDHSYARTEPLKEGKVNEEDGTVYYICGSTGEKSYSVTNNPDFHFAMASQDFNGIYITASTTDDKMTIVTHDVDGSIIDSYTKTKVKDECKDGHDYVYDGEYLNCRNCGYSKTLGDYTGFVIDEKTDKKMYFINGEFKTGWFIYGTTDIFYFDKNGLAEDLEILEDIPTTCLERGSKIVKNSLGDKKMMMYASPEGHKYKLNEDGENICSVCGANEKDISSHLIKMGQREIYSGGERKPIVTIDGLVRNVDYSVSYSNNINPGEATAIITGKGKYNGQVRKTFIIYRKISTMEASLSETNYTYDGTEKRPKVTISGLEEGKDYSVSYTNNVNVGEATVKITGISDYYTGTLTKTFTINKKDISNLEANLSYTECEYNGKEKKPEVTIERLQNGVDYTVSYENNVEVGKATVKITGMGNYTGTLTKTFIIKETGQNKPDISELAIKLENDSYIYTGSAIRPKVTIEGLEEDKDYVVNYENNVNIGQGKVIIEGIGNYRGTVTKTFEIKDFRIDISTLEIKMGQREIYSGGQRKPIVTIDGLIRNIDYSVSYSNNINPGEATAIITGKGAYTGQVRKTFIIYRKISTMEASLSETNYIYDGTEKKPKVTISGLEEGKDYSVSYTNNVNVGEATVTIKGISDYYTGTLTKTFTINKKDISNLEANLSYTECEYNGKERKPEVTIERLQNGVDYTVSYENNVEVGKATVKITGMGNYKGTLTKTFIIKETDQNKPDISELAIKLENDSYIYTGSAIRPKVTIEGLEEDKDYVVNYENNVNIGQGKVIIEGIGNYRGTVTKIFEIKDLRIDISTLEIKMGQREIYSGGQRKPIVRIDGLVRNVDYSVSYSNNINPGQGIATITGKGSYTGKVTKTFIIYRKISTMEASLSETNYIYDGTEKKPKVTIEGLEEGKDYSVSYTNNVNVGEATVTIKGISDYYTGTLTKTFTISESNISTLDLELSVSYSSKGTQPKVIINNLEEGKDYKFIDNSTDKEKSISIIGLDNYKGKKTFIASKDTTMIIEKNSIQYNIIDNKATVSCYTGNDNKVNIPSKIEGYKVTKIEKNAFSQCKDLEMINLRKSITEIEKGAFKNCKKLIINGIKDSYVNIFANENKIDFKNKN